MRRISRQVLIGALAVMLLNSACGKLTISSPTPVWTLTPAGQPAFPTLTLAAPAAPTGNSLTPQIPITGENAAYLQCEFCVDAVTHAVLIIPDSVSFNVNSDTPVSCLTADVTGGRRILICHGTPSTTFYLNMCTDPSNCLLFSVELQPCALLQGSATPVTTGTPRDLTPAITFTAQPPKKTRQPSNTDVPPGTPTPGGVSATSTPGVPPVTPMPTSYSAGPFVSAGQS